MIWFAVLLLMGTVLRAQVIENYWKDIEHVEKFYMSTLDSMVYVPAQDWGIKLDADRYYKDEENNVHVVVKITLGKDAHFAKVAIGNNLTVPHIVNDSVPTTTLSAGITQEVDFVLDKPEEINTVTVVTQNNHFKEYGYYQRSFALDYIQWVKDNSWKSLGIGLFAETIIAPMFGLEAVTYEVEIMENTETLGLYRVMNPYTRDVFPYSNYGCAEEGTYLEINACDPEGVYVPQQSLGFDFAGYTDVQYASFGAYYNVANGYDFETLKLNGYLGTLKDGVITLPLFENIYHGVVWMGGNGYYSGNGNAFCVTLPEAVEQSPTRAGSKGVIKHQKPDFVGKPFEPSVKKYLLKKQPANQEMQIID